MQSTDVILIIEAFVWLLMCVIPYLVGVVVLSCWLRNRVHHEQYQQIERIMMQQFSAFIATGQWPPAQSIDEQKAMKMLAKRLDLHEATQHTSARTL